MHAAKCYPFNKEASDYDVELPDDTGDEAYLATLAEWLPRLFETHKPQLVFFQAGVDVLSSDSFGRLGLTRAGCAQRNNAVYSACLAAGCPLVVTMGGGYSRPPDDSIEAHADVFRTAALRFSVP
jgi:acetoin utilization deacetylase AcuC-like enzyme